MKYMGRESDVFLQERAQCVLLERSQCNICNLCDICGGWRRANYRAGELARSLNKKQVTSGWERTGGDGRKHERMGGNASKR
jgi:MoaA/NifB/PqqE/SkfB family radical SAM enzyme